MARLSLLREALLLQFHITRRSPGHALMLVTAPLQAAIFISLAQYSHRPQAIVNAVPAPASLSLVVFGRVIIVVLFGVLTFAEFWLVAALCFGKVLTIAAPGMFLAAVVVTCFAMADKFRSEGTLDFS